MRPKPYSSELSADRRQGDYLDSPGTQKNLGISYDDSPHGSMPRLNKQVSYKDDSLILRIPNSSSEVRNGKGSEEI